MVKIYPLLVSFSSIHTYLATVTELDIQRPGLLDL